MIIRNHFYPDAKNWICLNVCVCVCALRDVCIAQNGLNGYRLAVIRDESIVNLSS